MAKQKVEAMKGFSMDWDHFGAFMELQLACDIVSLRFWFCQVTVLELGGWPESRGFADRMKAQADWRLIEK